MRQPAPPSPWPTPPVLDEVVLRPWLMPVVCQRLAAGHGEFLTELRPCVALFLRFEGIDYDEDPQASRRLDSFVRWVQGVLARYEGVLIDVSMGDKGSYLYCAFGAPVAHENDGWRALEVASELRQPPEELGFVSAVRLGLSRGTMRTGAYGGASRRTYGVLGDDVNLAARLMEHAATGEVLVSNHVREAADTPFLWERRAPLKAKGKTGPIPVFALVGRNPNPGLRVTETSNRLPMIGRVHELRVLRERASEAMNSRGQVIHVLGEAGIGKTRLVSEALRLGAEMGFAVHLGRCQSHGTDSSYLAWWSVWRGLFGLDPNASADAARPRLEQVLREVDPALCPRLPLVGAVLNLPIPDNDLTASFDAKLRKASLESLLLDCFRALARRQPLLLVLEDEHWMDPLSRDLLQIVARAAAGLPALLLVTARPREPGQLGTAFADAPEDVRLPLAYFTAEEAAQLARLKFRQLFGSAEPPATLLNGVIGRAEGNPFYLEQLLHYLRDQCFDVEAGKPFENLEWPATLHSLILSRIDRLTESQQAVLKIASVIGRLFQAAIIWGVQTHLDRDRVRRDLDRLWQLDLTPLDRPEPELTYMFKQVVTQEVAYESLPYATRAWLHHAIGSFLERTQPHEGESLVDLLAFHFDRSEDQAKKRTYLAKAAEAARARYANAAALSYYQRLLPLVDGRDRVETLLKIGRVWELLGDWKQAGATYQQAFEAAEQVHDRHALAQCQAATGDLLRKQGFYAEALHWLELARELFEALNDEPGVAQSLHAAGTVAATQGSYAEARALYERSLAIRRRLGDKPQTASLLSNLGILARFQTDYEAARRLTEESLAIRRELGDRWAIANSLNNLGVLCSSMRDFATARRLLEESLALNREVGDRWAVANVLSSLGEAALNQHDHPAARDFLSRSMAINRELGDRPAVAFVLEYFARQAAAQNRPARALRLAGAAQTIRVQTGAPLSPAEQIDLDSALAAGCAGLSDTQRAIYLAEGRALDLDQAATSALGDAEPALAFGERGVGGGG
jgi:predicted ATPase/class 3 adenylate cyclase